MEFKDADDKNGTMNKPFEIHIVSIIIKEEFDDNSNSEKPYFENEPETQNFANSDSDFSNRITEFVCTKCPLQLSTSTKLEKHLNKHIRYENEMAVADEKRKDEKLFKCEKCQAQLFSKSCLISHQKEVHKKVAHNSLTKKNTKSQKDEEEEEEEKDLYKCPYCKITIFGLSAFTKHLKIHEMIECKLCGQKVKKSSKNYHIKAHHITKKCKICHYLVQDLEGHLKKFHFSSESEPDLKCKDCSQNFETKYSFRFHINTIHGKEKCTICQKSFANAKKLHYHIRNQHYNDDLKCKICQKKIRSKALLWHHMALNHGEKKQCSICKLMVNKYRMKIHLRTAHGEKVECPICKNFFAKSALKYHKASIHGKWENCKICGRIFNKMSIKTHMRKVHENSIDGKSSKINLIKKEKFDEDEEVKRKAPEKNKDNENTKLNGQNVKKRRKLHYCPKCPIYLSSKIYLERHLKKHVKYEEELSKMSSDLRKTEEETREKAAQCIDCKGFLFIKKDLSNHRVNFHKSGPIICIFCKGNFLTNAGLNIHILAKHEKKSDAAADEESFKCPEPDCAAAGKEFSTKYLYSLHVKSHQTIECKLCGKLMKKSSLRDHNLYVHGTHKYKCEICGTTKVKEQQMQMEEHKKAFHSNGNGKNSLSVIKCSFENCHKVFESKIGLRHHLIAHGKEKCSICNLHFYTKKKLEDHLKEIHYKTYTYNNVLIE